jgi:isopenicillin-N epimerase
MVFVRNATEGVNAVLRSARFVAGDELLTTNHTYGACNNALRFVAEQFGAKVVSVKVPFPIESPNQVVDAVLRGVTHRTRLALIDHVTSITGLVFPISGIVRALRDRGVETLVDGAHAPGMLELDIESIGAGYYAANFHKWMCAPKGAGMLWVRRDLQERVAPPVISHGFARPLAERFSAMFDWTGTADPTPYLCVFEALQTMAAMLPGGWRTIWRRNHELALFARDALCGALGCDKPAPDHMLGSLASVPLPPVESKEKASAAAIYQELRSLGFETLVMPWQSETSVVLRVSAQLYNTEDQYQALAERLPAVLGL